MKINVLIVDDEPLALSILEGYVQKIPELRLAGKCKNALEAFSAINGQHIDLMLIDINMPEITGIDFLKSLRNPPFAIFTTAYNEYAVESYELNVIDYLLKPISFERFFRAINKAITVLQGTRLPQQQITVAPVGDNVLFVKSGGKLLKIDLNQLWLVEGLKDYLRLYTDTGKILIHSTMKSFEEQLAHLPYFVRVNKSYMVNLRYVSEVDGNALRIKDEVIVIGSTYKEAVHKIIDNYKIR